MSIPPGPTSIPNKPCSGLLSLGFYLLGFFLLGFRIGSYLPFAFR